MSKSIIVLRIFLVLFVLLVVGCRWLSPVTEQIHKPDKGPDISIYTVYAPVKINIMPLTEFRWAQNAQDQPKLSVYLSLLDSFDCQKKFPGVFRFELYEHLQRSAEPKGKRVAIWPDIDLTDPAENNRYWRDFLRAYQFDLDVQPQAGQSYILQATFMCPTGKRLSAEFELKYSD